MKLSQTTLAILFAATSAAYAQDGSLFLRPVQAPQGLTMENSSFMYTQLPPESRPRQLQKHDIITVLVDFRSRFLSEGDGQARKTQNLTAVLADWIKLENGSLKPALQRDGEPTIAGTLNSQNRSQSDLELRDSLSFRMAAEIVDIQPNGNLVIEGHQTIRNNEEQWRISLTGVVRREVNSTRSHRQQRRDLRFQRRQRRSGPGARWLRPRLVLQVVRPLQAVLS